MIRYFLTLIALGGASLSAQERVVTPAQQAIAEIFTDGKPLPALELKQKVLAEFVVPKGKHTIIYRRVSAPQAAPISPKNQALAAALLAPPAEMLAEEVEQFDRITYLNLSVVVYPQGVTELKWIDEEGSSKRVFARATLEFLPMSLSLDLADWAYEFSFFHWGNGLFGDDVTLRQLPPDVRAGVVEALALPEGRFAQVTAENGKFSAITEREIEALDAILAYSILNQAELSQNHAAAAAQAEEWAESKRLHDLQPKTYEIRIWKN
jgi:hypothetical protein